MAKVTVIQVIYNNRKFIEPVFSAIFNQSFKDLEVVAVIAGNKDGSKEFLESKFPQVKIVDPGYNIGFAAGHNLIFEKYDSEFFQLVNPDFIMEPDYVIRLLEVFGDPTVGAATGKLYNIPLSVFNLSADEFIQQKSRYKTLDTTGLIMAKSGRVRDRGQHKLDKGQFDKDVTVAGVCAAGAMYRRRALEDVKEISGYFDSDFHTTYEDVDLSQRMVHKGWKNIFVPQAVGFHARGAAGTIGGYKKVFAFVKYHRKLNPLIRKYSYQNHIFTYIKNSPYFYPQFFIREFFMFIYILLFEASTLQILPRVLKLFPTMWKKRELIQMPSTHAREGIT